jgi:predicted DCC family thiol-disulfide oxidoreductase YuxK
VRDEEAAGLLQPVPEAQRFASWHLVRPGRPPVGHGVGGRDLLLELRRTQRLGRLLGVVHDALLDAAYGLVARHRSLLGRLVPDGHAPRRYP